MTELKLKTVKDLGEDFPQTDWVRKGSLKKEAIKWVKHWRNILEVRIMTENTKAVLEGKISGITQFHNITSEDLRTLTKEEIELIYNNGKSVIKGNSI